MLGQGSSEMLILAIGIVKDIDESEWRVYVDWVNVESLDRKVPLRGCTASVHGMEKGSGTPETGRLPQRQWFFTASTFCSSLTHRGGDMI